MKYSTYLEHVLSQLQLDKNDGTAFLCIAERTVFTSQFSIKREERNLFHKKFQKYVKGLLKQEHKIRTEVYEMQPELYPTTIAMYCIKKGVTKEQILQRLIAYHKARGN